VKNGLSLVTTPMTLRAWKTVTFTVRSELGSDQLTVERL